jgi:hypothetical protein
MNFANTQKEGKKGNLYFYNLSVGTVFFFVVKLRASVFFIKKNSYLYIFAHLICTCLILSSTVIQRGSINRRLSLPKFSSSFPPKKKKKIYYRFLHKYNLIWASPTPIELDIYINIPYRLL